MSSKNLRMIMAFVIGIQSFLFSQLNELKIQPQDPPAEIPIFRNYEDEAAIIIYSPIPLKFESTLGLVADKSDPDRGEYILILHPKKQIIFVQSQSAEFKEDRIEIKTLLPKQCIYYSIEPKQKPPNPNKGNFILRTVPSGARFEIEGLPIQGLTPYQSEEFLAETFKIWISKEKYESREIDLPIVKGETVSRTVPLVPKFGFITILTNNSDAELYINGVAKNYKADKPLELPVGQWTIKLKRPYYDDFIETVKVTPNDDPRESIPITANLIRQKGRLVVNTDPNNAQVYLNGKSLGNTPLDKTIDAGRYILEVRKDNHRNERRNIEVPNDQTISENITMYENGIIHISGTYGATVYINEQYEGTIPINQKIMEQGEYKIRIQKNGYDTQEKTFTVRAEERTLNYNLIKTQGRFFRWTLLGNKRISSILNSYAITAGYYQAPLTSDLIFTLTGEKSDLNAQGIPIDLSMLFTPITINGGIGLGLGPNDVDFTDVSNDTLKYFFYYGNIGLTPFVLWEAFYPTIGLAFNGAEFKYINETENQKVVYNSFGIFYEARLLIKYGRPYGWLFKFTYQDMFDKSAYKNFWFANIGFWYTFGYKGE